MAASAPSSPRKLPLATTAPPPLATPATPVTSHSTPHPDLATVQALLGPEITSWNFSDASLKAALELRTERERTRQEFYKLEMRKRSAELLQEVMRYNIPSSMIPMLFNGAPVDIDAIPDYVHGFAKQHERYPTSPVHSNHQRNLSLPQQPTIIQSEYQRQPQLPPQQQQQQQLQQQPPPPPLQQPSSKPHKFRHHAHHASTSAIPQSSYYSPTRAPVAPVSYAPQVTAPSAPSTQAPTRASGRPAWQTTPNTYFPPPQNPYPPNPGSPSTSVHHIIQFHHWQPNQSKPAGSTSPPKKDGQTPLAVIEDPSGKRRRSVSGETDGHGSPAVSNNTAPSSAVASAAAHSRRRSMHSRNKSETAVIRSDMSRISLTGSPPPSHPPSVHEAPPPKRTRTPEDTAGFNYLAQVAAEESKRLASPEKKASSPTEMRSHKQNVNFMITE